MKIAFVNPGGILAYPPSGSNSIAIVTYQLARCSARSHEVILYGYRNPGENEWREEVDYQKEGLRCRLFYPPNDQLLGKLLTILVRWGFYHAQRPFWTSKLYFGSYIWQVANDLRKQQCDIVHINNYSQFIPFIRALFPEIKIVLHMHSDFLAQLDYCLIERRLSQVDLIIGCSEYITNNIRRRFPQFAERCHTIYNGVDFHHFVGNKCDKLKERKGAKQQLLYVGRVSPEKGLHVLIDAWKKVVDYYPQVQLKIVGPDSVAGPEYVTHLSPDDPKILNLAPFYKESYRSHLLDKLSSSVANSISFIDYIPHLKLTELYQDADIFIFPSVWHEPFGLPIVEAMAAELPVVATRAGAFPEIIEEGKTGLLVERGDADALAEAILHLLSDEQLRQSMGKAGRQRVIKYFSWEQSSENLLSLYQTICFPTDF